jgi:hypothetical protein
MTHRPALTPPGGPGPRSALPGCGGRIIWGEHPFRAPGDDRRLGGFACPASGSEVTMRDT